MAAQPKLVRDGQSSAQAQGWAGEGDRSRRRGEKKLIERAYLEGEKQGLAVWGMDEAGPFQAVPYPGGSWQQEGEPAIYPHEYVRGGTAKMMTLFHPLDGRVRVKGVESCPNAVLHGWLKAELEAVLEELPQPEAVPSPEENRRAWEVWQEGLSVRITLGEELPP